MPTSHLFQLNEIVQLIKVTDPGRLLDIGIGFGKYGFLSREYLELWDGREQYNDWKRTIDGIEAFEGYITPLQRLVYDEIYIGNAMEVLPAIAGRYDLVLLIDVLEHFCYQDGLRLIRECKRIARNLLISVPKIVDEQGALFGNQFERHRFQWRKKHLRELDASSKFFVRHRYSTICYIGADSRKVLSTMRKNSRIHFWTRQVRPAVVSALEYCHLKSLVKYILRGPSAAAPPERRSARTH